MDINKIEFKLLQFCILSSIFSQIEPIMFIFRPMMYLLWAIVFILIIFQSFNRIHINRFLIIYISAFLFLIFICLNMSVIGLNHMNSNYLHILTIPLLVSFIGTYYTDKIDSNLFQTILKTYLMGALIYAVWVNIEYFYSYTQWLNQTMYSFLLKNSAAQIWSAAILIIIFLLEFNSKFQKFFWYCIAFYLFLMIAISQCRTAILALFIVLLVYIIFKSKRKLLLLSIICVSLFFIFNIPIFREFLDQSLFLNKYHGADLNTFSSGRLHLWNLAFESFIKNPIFGVGEYYVDCSYLCVLAELGIVGFICVESVWLSRIYYNFRNGKSFIYASFLFSITCFYLVESILEGYPPFGPGVSSFMFWFLSSFLTSNKNEKLKGVN